MPTPHPLAGADWHTDYSLFHSDIQTTSIFTQTYLILLSFLLGITDYSHSLSIWIFKSIDHAHPPPTGRCWLTHRLLPFSLRHKDYSHSYTDIPNTEKPNLLSIWIFKPIDHDHPPPTGRCWLTHKLLLVSLRHTDYFHFYTDIPNTTFILTWNHRLLPFIVNLNL